MTTAIQSRPTAAAAKPLPSPPARPSSSPGPTPTPATALDLAPPEVREELNRTYTQYGYLSNLGSVASFAVSIQFFMREHGCEHDDLNRALRDCRSPEAMSKFRFASDLMGYFADRVIEHRRRREVLREQVAMREGRDDGMKRATPDQIARLREQFAEIGTMN